MQRLESDHDEITAVIDKDYFAEPSKRKAVFNGKPSELKGLGLDFPKHHPKTLSEALERAASTDKAIIFIDDRGKEHELTYRELRNQALHALASLQSMGAQTGKAVILQLDELDQFLVSFWACVLGGLVPVPILPFRRAHPKDSSFKKLQKIATQLNQPIILMSDRNADVVRRAMSEEGEESEDTQTLELSGSIATFGDIENSEKDGIVHRAKPKDLAFLQFTSGSTSFPKGTRVSHSGVLATIHGMVLALDIKESTRLLNWMPFYHDMGIIAGHIMAVVTTSTVVAMKPFTFVRRPLLWLEKIAEHRINITFSPNFGLRRILEKANPKKLEALDLSCLDVILNGAEPISLHTCNRFLELLNTHCGLKKDCMLAGYGLAEASLAVSIAPRGEPMRKHILNRDALGCGDKVEHLLTDDPKASAFADEGPAVAGIKLRIVDEADELVPNGTVGHVQIKGRSVTRGYFSNKKANKQSFCDDWFRTGDLGFVCEGRFIITGRVKDVVFVNGQNYYSHDFEHACEDIEGLDRLVVIGHHDEASNDEAIIAFVACNKKYTGAREKTEILRAVQMRINQGFDVTPTAFVLLKSAGEIPKTTSGKIIRHKLIRNYVEGHFSSQCIPLVELLEIAPDLSDDPSSGKHVTIAELKLLIRCWWSDVLGISEKAIGDHDPFFTLGGTSIKAMEVLALAEESVDCLITHDMFKEYDTIYGLAHHIARENILIRCKLNDLVQVAPDSAERVEEQITTAEDVPDAANDSPPSIMSDIREDDIAIIGMGCIFPQADNVDKFWQLLKEGRDCITEAPHERFNINQYYGDGAGTENQTVSKWGSFIENHYFDPGFFNLTEQEAITMDPHQREFLSASWQAIQDSGLVNIEGSRMGVFVGASGTGFYQQREDARMTPSTLTGSLANLAAARVSNAFNLKGPSLSVDTACSSSLVSVDLACKSILSGESDTAIAGGVQVMESISIYLLFSRAGILSPDGKCYTFSDKANGFVPGEGAGAVILKSYRKAIEDGDRVYAVIRASAMNNDGASLGIMSPNPGGQEDVIRTALKKADLDPADIGYVEAHGTGTHIGDLIEVRSLSLAFNENKRVENQSCAIGSVKTNLGHQLAAAGISGLMKAALSVYHKEIPATLNCEEARKELKLAETPFFICKETMPWPKDGPLRLAAVNSFGFGGTNAHVILSNAYHEEAHHLLPSIPGEPQLFCLSAKSEHSLAGSRAAFAGYAKETANDAVKDVAFTYGARRAHYRQNRIAIVANSLEDAAKLAQGEKVEGGSIIENMGMPRTRRRIAWLLSGQGSQFPCMGKTLFQYEPVFRDTVNRIDEIARPLLGISLRNLLVKSLESKEINSTTLTQPVVFAMDYALAMLWNSWGVKPDFMLGHSIGEYVAATLANVFTLEDAVRVVVKRGALMGSVPMGGGMTAILQTPDEVNAHIDGLGLPLDIAAYNGPTSTVVSGSLDALQELHGRLDEQNSVYQPLAVSHAFHSRQMVPVLEEFKQFLSEFTLKTPSHPVVSNVTGKLYQGTECEPDYWVDHIRKPVQLHKGVLSLAAAGAETYLEIGAQAHLAGLTRRIVNGSSVILSSLPKNAPGSSDSQHLALTMANLYACGTDIDWAAYYTSHGERRWRNEAVPASVERCERKIGVAGGQMRSVPTYTLERRSMFRLVGNQSYPFQHLFNRIGTDQYEYLPDPDCVLFTDHVVSRAPMLSGAGQCDLICHLHSLSFAHAPKHMRDISFQHPWLAKSKLTVSFSGKEEKQFAVTDARGNVVFKGFTNTNTRCSGPPALDAEVVNARLPMSYTQDEVYNIFQKCGMDYGSFHRKIVSMRASETEVLALLRPPEENPANWTHGYYLHPGILDSAFQATAGLLMARMDNSSDEQDFPTMVPVGIESMCIYKFLQGGQYYSHVTLDGGADADINGDTISCTICVYDMEGTPCAFIEKLQLKRFPSVARPALKPSTVHVANEADQHAGSAEFFHTTWKESPAPAIAAQESSRWLIFGSQDAAEETLAPALTEFGVDALLVPHHHYKDANEVEMKAILEKSGTINGILFMGDYDQVSTDIDVADTGTMRRLFFLLRAAGKHKEYKRARFIRATRNAHRLDTGNDALDIRKSLATGFLRTARIEFPLMDVRQVDFGDTEHTQIAGFLHHELTIDKESAPETFYQRGKRHSLSVEPKLIQHSHERNEVFNSDKVFWIIGGTSGVGQVLARYLATNFKCKLVLSGSRRLPEPEAYDKYLSEHSDGIASTIEFLREIESIGSQVGYVSTDVRSADSLRLALESIRSSYSQINGIYYGALQLDDKMILQKEWPGYRNMMDMRVNGVAEIIRQTAADKLDFFVLFSSLAGITGNIGQSDYSASNVYMDMIPYTQNEDNPCRYISVQWGPWALGQQVSEIVLEHMHRNGFLHISALLGMEALEKIILSDQRNIAFVPGSEDARHIAENINGLRQGLSAKPKRKNPEKPVQVEAAIMSDPKPETMVSGGQAQLLMDEFEKQRDMFMKLCESQNALLTGAFSGRSLELPVRTPTPAVVSPAPTVAPAPPAAAPVAPPVAEAPVFTPTAAPLTEEAKTEPAADAGETGRPENLFEFVRELMARAVEMHAVDIDPDQNFMELGADSMTAMSMVKEMEQRYDIELPATLLFEYATLSELVEYLRTEVGEDEAGGDGEKRA